MSIYRAGYNNNANDSWVGLLSDELEVREPKTTQPSWSTFRPQVKRPQQNERFEHRESVDTSLQRSSDHKPISHRRKNVSKPQTDSEKTVYMSSQTHAQTLPVNRGQLPKIPRYNVPNLSGQTLDSPRKFHESANKGDSSVSSTVGDAMHSGEYSMKSVPPPTLKTSQDDIENLQMLRALEAEITTLRSTLQSYDTWPGRPQYDPAQVYESLPSTKGVDRTRKSASTLCKMSKHNGLYQLGNILDPNVTPLKRIIWVIIILACVSLFTYNVIDRVQHFTKSTTRTIIQTKNRQTQTFPSVTVCNLNRFRLTKIKEAGLLTKPNRDELLCRENDKSCQKITKTLSYEKSIMIAGCRWNGIPCSEANFTETFVHDRWCYNIAPLHPIVSASGSTSGLTILLNVEQYEYMPDVRTAVGVKLYIHSPNHSPSGEPINVGVGSHASLAINSVCEQGGVYTDDKKVNVKIVAGAGEGSCVSDDMPSSCSVINGIFSNCDNSGFRPNYRTTLSYSAMSAYAAESQVRTFKRISDIKRRFIKAMDTYHRTDVTVRRYDINSFNNITKNFAADALASGQLLKNAQVYRKQANKSIDGIVQSFSKLNDTVRTYLPFFTISSHLTFTHFFKRIYRDMKDIQGLLDRPNSIERLDDILDKLKPLVDAKENPVFDSAIAGIELFIKDIVNGYAQMYEEFKKKQSEYRYATVQLLNITMRLNGVLKPHYDLLSEAMADGRETKTEFERFQRSVKQQRPAIEKMKNQITLIEKMYKEHRKQIINFADILKDAEVKLFAARKALLQRVNYLWASLPDMQNATNDLSKIFGKVKAEYARDKHNKSTLEDYLTSLGVFKLTDETRASIEKLHDDNVKMSSALVGLDESIRVIANRLAAVPSYPGIASLYELDHVISMNKFIDDVTKHVASVNTMRTELIDYKNSLRIDYKFYMNNFLRCDVFFRDFSEQIISKRVVYGLIDFACDIGGCVALYLGISFLTVLQIFDVITRSVMASGSEYQSNSIKCY